MISLLFGSVVKMNDNSNHLFGFRCNWSDCQYVSVQRQKLEQHLRTVHDRNGLFICQKSNCKEKFETQKQLSLHSMSDHSKQFKCDYDDCGFECRTRQHLNDHLRRHKGEKPYDCPVEGCGKAFATRQEVRRHKSSVHSNQTFICDWPGCELGFRSQKLLSTHQSAHI